jgi:hypothetical protein
MRAPGTLFSPPMPSRRRLALALLYFGLSLFLLLAGARALGAFAWPGRTIVSSFEMGDEFWEVVGAASGPVWLAQSGNPPGCIAGTGTNVAEAWSWRAPDRFLGDCGEFYGGTLTFESRRRAPGMDAAPLEVVLEGRMVTVVAPVLPAAADEWASYTLALREGAGWQKDDAMGRVEASAADLRAALGDLVDLRLPAGSGQGEVWLDNVELQSAGSLIALAGIVPFLNRLFGR